MPPRVPTCACDSVAGDDRGRGAGPVAAATRESLVTTWVDTALRLHSLSGIKVLGTTISGPTIFAFVNPGERVHENLLCDCIIERRRIKNRENWGRLDRLVPGPGWTLPGSARLQQGHPLTREQMSKQMVIRNKGYTFYGNYCSFI